MKDTGNYQPDMFEVLTTSVIRVTTVVCKIDKITSIGNSKCCAK